MPDSSPEQNTGVVETEEVKTAPAETTDVKETSAESSPAEGAKGDILSAVKAALKPPENSPASETEGSEPAKAAGPLSEEGDKGTEQDDLTEEELARLKPKTRKRIENLTAARRERDGIIAELKPQADNFQKITRFIEDAGLSREDVNTGFEVMRLLKTEKYQEAYTFLKPIYTRLQQMMGEVLPEDLQAAVNEGRITEDYARDLAKTRTVAASTSNQLQRRDKQDEERQQTHQRQEVATRVSTAVSEWEKSKAGSDPDWKLKQSRVMEMVQLETLRREKADSNFCWTPETATQFADEALKRVNTEFSTLRPKPKAITPVTDVASTRSVAKPKNALEAAKQALAAAG